MGDEVSIASLACFPADQEFAEALVDKFAEQSPLIQARLGIDRYSGVRVPVRLGKMWICYVLCRDDRLSAAKPHSMLIDIRWCEFQLNCLACIVETLLGVQFSC